MPDTLTTATDAPGRRASSSLLRAAADFARGGVAPTEPIYTSEHEPAAPTRTPSSISARTELVGSINTPEELVVHGRVEGDIRASKIVVCAGGVVKGQLTADVIVIHGLVEGRVDGQDVMLCGEASVNGEITHRTLGIERTAGFEGTVKRLPMAEPKVATPATASASAPESKPEHDHAAV